MTWGTAPLLLLGFFGTALLYAGAGFAGGSTYLALLVLTGWKTGSIASTALICNLLFSGQGTVLFHAKGSLKLPNALPFLVASIPMALAGGLFRIQTQTWLLILGWTLLLSGGALMIPKREEGIELAGISRRILGRPASLSAELWDFWPAWLASGEGSSFHRCCISSALEKAGKSQL